MSKYALMDVHFDLNHMVVAHGTRPKDIDWLYDQVVDEERGVQSQRDNKNTIRMFLDLPIEHSLLWLTLNELCEGGWKPLGGSGDRYYFRKSVK